MASQYPPIVDDDVDDVLEDEESPEDELEEDEETVELSDSSKSDVPEDFSIAARQRLRDELNQQVEAFLARGGQIREIPSSLNASRPKKPVSDFGDRAL